MSNIQAAVAEKSLLKIKKRVFIFETWHTGKERESIHSLCLFCMVSSESAHEEPKILTF